MAINSNDVRLFASERMTDNPDGGGRMSATVILDGVENNVFPDITDVDRLLGRLNIRKKFGAVISDNADPYLTSHVVLDDEPDDPGTSSLLFAFGTFTTELAALLVELNKGHFTQAFYPATFDALGAGSSALISASGAVIPKKYAIVRDTSSGAKYFRTIESDGVSGRATFDAAVPGPYPRNLVVAVLTEKLPGSRAPAMHGVATSTSIAAANATQIAVDSVFGRIVPYDGVTTYPTTGLPAWLVDPNAYAPLEGLAPVLNVANPVLVHHTAALAPQTVANAQVVNVGRTGLARIRVVGSNGSEIARFLRGLPAPSGVGCTADLTTGLVTFTDVSGMAQPVTIEHRIEELNIVASVLAGVPAVGLARPLSREYPIGSKVSSMLMLGDLQARVSGGFTQTAWLGTWADAPSGGQPNGDFLQATNPITVTNKGAITQRWYVLFTNTTAFRVIGEFVGEVGAGNTATNFAPLNPATGAPFFTIPAAGWSAGWAAGNVYRFDTFGANAPHFESRCVSPSAAGANDSSTPEFRGYVNA